jgi:hypothetical protein
MGKYNIAGVVILGSVIFEYTTNRRAEKDSSRLLGMTTK